MALDDDTTVVQKDCKRQHELLVASAGCSEPIDIEKWRTEKRGSTQKGKCPPWTSLEWSPQ
jgi:hypothetical protein